MLDELHMPWTASGPIVFGTFVASLVLFDLVLVRWLRLGDLHWKRVDYIWLGFTALSLFGAVAEVRIASANAQIAGIEAKAIAALDSLESSTRFYAMAPGPVCRTFVRDGDFPSAEQLAETQREYDQGCIWMKALNVIVSRHDQSQFEPIDVASLPVKPQVAGGDLKHMFAARDEEVRWYNDSVAAVFIGRAEARHGPLETALIFVGPFLLAIALALRITKVTGEIKLRS